MPGSSNFLQWNPSGANQETDAAFVADAQRLAGASNPAIWTSALANKVLFQTTTFIKAMADALAAKGYALSDANVATLAGVLANVVSQVDLVSALALYAPLVSPALAGSPIAPTQLPADNSTKLATTGFVKSQSYLQSITGAMVLTALGFTPVQQGGGAGQGANKIYIGYDGATGHLRCTVDATDFGDFAWVSDLAAYAKLAGGTAFTGYVTCPNLGAVGYITAATAPANDNSVVLANTAWIQTLLANLLSTNGYQKLPNGLIMQWGTGGTTSGYTVGQFVTITLPLAFPTNFCSRTVSNANGGALGDFPNYNIGAGTLSSFNVYASTNGQHGFYWTAVGY